MCQCYQQPWLHLNCLPTWTRRLLGLSGRRRRQPNVHYLAAFVQLQFDVGRLRLPIVDGTASRLLLHCSRGDRTGTSGARQLVVHIAGRLLVHRSSNDWAGISRARQLVVHIVGRPLVHHSSGDWAGSRRLRYCKHEKKLEHALTSHLLNADHNWWLQLAPSLPHNHMRFVTVSHTVPSLTVLIVGIVGSLVDCIPSGWRRSQEAR